MNGKDFLEEMRQRGVLLEAKGDRLRIDAPEGIITPELLTMLTEHKAAVLEILAPPWHGAVVSIDDWPALKRKGNLRVVSSSWEGRGPVEVVVT